MTTKPKPSPPEVSAIALPVVTVQEAFVLVLESQRIRNEDILTDARWRSLHGLATAAAERINALFAGQLTEKIAAVYAVQSAAWDASHYPPTTREFYRETDPDALAAEAWDATRP